MPENRKHIAVMFTDIVGYTALMGSDESKAFDMLKRNHTIHESLIKKHKGKLIKEVGDGTLATFPLASDAVRCAIDIQSEGKRQNIPLKIGVHQGEMILVGADVFGDGVNVASRLQESADKGCIYISGAVYRDVKNKAGIEVEYLEDKTFKNVDEPVRIYKVHCEVKGESQAMLPEKSSGKISYYIIAVIAIVVITILIWQFLPVKESSPPSTVASTDEVDRSIAVLPFTNMSNDPDQEYFSDGMMEEILLHLYKIGDLEVTSRTSSEKYGDTDKLIGEIASELGVKYILEGSVRKVGDRVRITAQLIDAVNDIHLWAESYDKELKDVFTIQSDIAQQIANSLKAEISPELKRRIERIPTNNLKAYNLFLQARFIMNYNIDLSESTKVLLERALTLDPEFADAYAELAWYWLVKGNYIGDADSKKVAEKALPLLAKAIEINQDLADAHLNLACYHLWYQWDFKAAEKEFNIFTELAPSAKVRGGMYVDLMLATGRSKEALNFSEEILKDDPNNGYNWIVKANCYSFINQDEKAANQIAAALNLLPENNYLTAAAMNVYVYLGMYDKVKEVYDKYLTTRNLKFPRLLSNLAIAFYYTGEKGKAENILDKLIAKSDTTSVGSPAYYAALIYAQIGDVDLAFEYLEKAYDAHEVEMYWLKVEPPFEPLRNDPRWNVMLEKVGFPE